MGEEGVCPVERQPALNILPELLRLKEQVLALERRLQAVQQQEKKEEDSALVLRLSDPITGHPLPSAALPPSETLESKEHSTSGNAAESRREEENGKDEEKVPEIILASDVSDQQHAPPTVLSPSISPNEEQSKRFRRRLASDLKIETSPSFSAAALMNEEETVRGHTPTLSLSPSSLTLPPELQPHPSLLSGPLSGRKLLRPTTPKSRTPRNRLPSTQLPPLPPSSPSMLRERLSVFSKESSPNKRKHQEAEMESLSSTLTTPEPSPRISTTPEGKPFITPEPADEYTRRGRFKRRRKEFTLKDYFMSELLGVQDLSNAEAFRYERVQNFFHVPLKLEKLIIYGFFVSCDCFLYVFTYLPIRIVLAAVKILGKLLFPRHRWFSFHRSQAYDLMRGLILLVVSLALHGLDMSRVYHYIRGQAMIKLYVLSAMIEIFDKLGSSLGQDILDGLYWTTRLQPYARRIVIDFIVAAIFVLLHAMLLFCQLVTVNIAINSSNSALLTLLISNNFAELKTVVFKKFEEQNLFQISCSDIVERFKLSLFTGLIILQTLANDSNAEHLEGVLQGSLLMMLAEVLVDWIKHAFISKFNRIDADVYSKYVTVILDHTHAAARRLGLSSLPLACVVIRMVSMCTSSLSISFITYQGALVAILAFLCLVALKVLNSILLMSHACRFGFIIPEVPAEPGAEAQKLDQLVNIERYSLFKKEIV